MQKPQGPPTTVRTNFIHGLGDCVQYTIVLKHIEKYRPEWLVEAAACDGRSSCFRNICHKPIEMRTPRKRYDKNIDVIWAEPNHFTEFHNLPMTKVTRSLMEQFKIDPDESLYEYHMVPTSGERNIAKQYLSALPESKGKIGIHYRGTSSTHTKDLQHDMVKRLCNKLAATGYTPVILDWSNSCNFVDNSTIFCPGRDHFLWSGRKFAEATVIAALISKMKMFIGIDSGPLHVAGATKTPTLGVWTYHHPVNFYDLCNNVHHLLPRNSRSNIRGKNRRAAETYFQTKYNHTYYSDLNKALMETVSKMLNEELCMERDPASSIITPNRWWTLQPHSTLL